ncbi:DNA mismatch repair protein MutT [Bacillus pseudomycoides]|uniref:NUDIX domain-containing protein n=1 Tax=Bacillus pseudomycoides TaxID=64104 RepID=UPI000BED1E72|nr:NUDIX domain-containing protein [Bacillus pseudomycoides]PDY02155.1 DNA mismatch repair protein MutT [Bacillus pseudomycoides]PEK78660.1 DNA mismatch repair protein MutT [Bacillus pseudomycoides]PEN07353.1 DNA mismatch repair protein MutT [Bacillus pseudomycoides]PGB89478.1 DNA mismatch repair protein MutT [Bacillus pseudomycoides]PHE53599.1 DNA mismatch repair protein MutT [Bacillus pseudomycoides]
MKSPLLRAEAIIIDEEYSKILVQCNEEETFYRFPGGSIEYGESACEAIIRELLEEYDLQVRVAELAIVNEHIFEVDGESHHQCTLFHWCKPVKSISEVLFHKEHKNIILIWKSIQELKDKLTYPEGIVSLIEQKGNNIAHLLTQKVYS